jgi:hypothetical protein
MPPCQPPNPPPWNPPPPPCQNAADAGVDKLAGIAVAIAAATRKLRILLFAVLLRMTNLLGQPGSD